MTTTSPPPTARPGGDPEPKPLGQEAQEAIADAATIGARRLERPAAGDAITAFVGGMSVSFGAVAMAWGSASVGGGTAPASPGQLVGALLFPVGLVILLVGKSELFTENFFLPVTAVLHRRGSLGGLAKLWAITLAANLVGTLVFALLISRPGVLDPAPAQDLIAVARQKTDGSFVTAFVQALFAGWLMTMLTWLLVAAEGFGPRLAIIWPLGALIVLGRFNHVVISAAEIFMAMLLGADITPGHWLTSNFLPALIGNVLGGVGFVTLLTHVQAQYQRR